MLAGNGPPGRAPLLVQVQGGRDGMQPRERGLALRPHARRKMTLDESGIERSADERRVFEHANQKFAIRHQTAHREFAQATHQPPPRLFTRCAMCDQLGEQRVVVHPDFAAPLHAAVDAQPWQHRRAPQRDAARSRQELALGIFGIQPRFDGVARDRERVLRNPERATLRHLDLHAHEVEPGDRLGHGMLDLQARVDLEEVERAARIEQELDGAGADVPNAPRKGDRRRAHACTQRGVHGRRRRRRLLDHLLVAALHGTLALEAVNERPVRVTEDLHLHVPRRVEVALDEQRAIAERGERLAPRGLDGFCKRTLGAHHAHPAPPASRGRLDEHGVAERTHVRGNLARVESLALEAVDDRQPGLARHALALDLAPHAPDRVGARADEDEPRVETSLREVRALGEKAVAGMQSVRADRPRRVEDALDVQVRLGARRGPDAHGLVGLGDVRRIRVRVGVHGDARDAHLAQRAQDAARNLTAIGNEDLLETSHVVGLCHRTLTCGTRRTHARPRSARCARPTAQCPAPCGCRADR